MTTWHCKRVLSNQRIELAKATRRTVVNFA